MFVLVVRHARQPERCALNSNLRKQQNKIKREDRKILQEFSQLNFSRPGKERKPIDTTKVAHFAAINSRQVACA